MTSCYNHIVSEVRTMKKKTVELNQSQYDAYKTIRKDWGSFNPTTRVAEDKTKYNRKKAKSDAMKEVINGW
jgi:hypothetical protein